MHKKNIRKYSLILGILLIVFAAICFSNSVLAADNECAGAKTNLIKCGESAGGGMAYLLGLVLNILTFGVGAAGVIGIVISGVQYMTSAGNEAQMIKAKHRIIEVLIGLVAYGVAYTAINWLNPGDIRSTKIEVDIEEPAADEGDAETSDSEP